MKDRKKGGSNQGSIGRQSLNQVFQSFFFRIFGAIFSGILLVLAFPGVGNSFLAFVGLVPLMFAVQSVGRKKAAFLGLLTGFSFSLGTLFWLHNLTGKVEGVALKMSALLGYGILAFYYALYFIPVAVTISACVKL